MNKNIMTRLFCCFARVKPTPDLRNSNIKKDPEAGCSNCSKHKSILTLECGHKYCIPCYNTIRYCKKCEKTTRQKRNLCWCLYK